jgi:hypothetical protein
MNKVTRTMNSNKNNEEYHISVRPRSIPSKPLRIHRSAVIRPTACVTVSVVAWVGKLKHGLISAVLLLWRTAVWHCQRYVVTCRARSFVVTHVSSSYEQKCHCNVPIKFNANVASSQNKLCFLWSENSSMQIQACPWIHWFKYPRFNAARNKFEN